MTLVDGVGGVNETSEAMRGAIERVVAPGARRPRRLRRTEALRRLVSETLLTPDKLVLPIFIMEGDGVASETIDAMPGVERHSIDSAIRLVREALGPGVRSFALFPRIADEDKTPDGIEAANRDNLVCRAVGKIKASVPEASLITDVALDPFSSLGHDGIVIDGEVDNDASVEMLCRQALVQAEAGADVIAPSDMMDGRIGAIRQTLDVHGYEHVALLSYAAKYASAFYGPFRSALDSAPAVDADVPGDKKTYQMDPGNKREASIEAALDVEEGADILMVKPALPYLDVIAQLRAEHDVPIAAYHVSGEYAMIKAAAERGWIDGTACMVEAITACARAGADIVFTYGAQEYARWWHEHYGR